MAGLSSHRLKYAGLVVCMLFAFAARIQAQQSPHGRLSIPCTDCHTTASWKELAKAMRFDHSETSFPLKGQHSLTACAKCHTDKKFRGTPTRCIDCHRKDFDRVPSPNHKLGNFNYDCTTCHTMKGWLPSVFQHSKTNFQLVGAHEAVDCASCHKNNKFAGLSRDCFACHQPAFDRTVSPNHKTAQFSHDCVTCHTMDAWKPSTFDHQKTKFQLAGAHKTADCTSCHKNGQFTGLPTDCYTCHKTDYSRPVIPNHVTAQLSHDCVTCHTMNTWKPSSFEHKKTAFALAGAHLTTDCSSCHKNGQFKGTATDCYTCHQTDFAKVVTPNHVTAQLSHDCTTCHTTTAWKPSSFDHQKTKFQLVGAHRTADCTSCHKNGQFTGLPTDCYTCHQTDFAKVTTPNHVTAQLSHDCTTCHTTTAWKPSTFNHSTTLFALTGAHVTTQCASCHTNGQFKGVTTDCYTCHKTDFATPVNPNHVTAQLSHDCTTCHTTTAWKPSSFDHQKTKFQLVGAHRTADCTSCHKNGQFTGLPTDCYTCHQTDFAKVVTPNHVTAQLSHDCTTCHTTTAWKPSTFNHSATLFALTGAHVTTQCASCHTNGQFKGVTTDCYTCHKTDFATPVNPNHVTAQLSHDCTTCHTTTAWKPSSFDHQKTKFQLVGAHRTADCTSCHKNGQFTGLPTDCYTCHQTDFAKVVTPNHVTAQLSHDCTTCHTTTAWKPSTFNHSTTLFALTGAHVTTQCASCHTNGQFKGVTTDCYTCHKTDFATPVNPNHVTAQLSHDCTTCHTTTAWKPSSFDHQKTKFQLVGAHRTADCTSCHKNGQFTGLPTDCYTCHQTDFAKVTTPNHVTAQLSHDCTTCHSTTAWKPSTFNHSTTLFALTGAHVTTQCASCHTNGQFKGVTTDCYTCHKTDFATPVNPNHVTAQLSHDCTTCHTTTAWKPSSFDHKKTAFALVGAHLTTDCSSCHKNGQFKGTATDCYTCHQTDFAKVVTPNHVTAQFSHDCTKCHSNTAWKPSTFNHAVTTFPLTGGHAAVDCASCHKNGQFTGTPKDCWSCHQTNYTTAIPNHVTAQLSHDCTTCHSTTGWKPSTFNHSTTAFPLTGAHTTANCASCHTNGVFKGTPVACWSCHQTDFSRPTNPNHVTAQLSHDCTTCHSTSVWKPSTFDHQKTTFQLLGAHKTTDCSSCHKNGQFTGTPKDCWSCHQTNFAATTTPNHVTSQFSHDCTTCHSMTAWKPSTFNHSTTAFPLTGAHQTTACLFCHKNGQFKGTPVDCYTCHTADYAGVTDPNHAAGNFDHNCATCHTTTAWSPATFDHNKTNFKLTGAHSATPCANCHVGGKYTGTTTVCYTCHTTDYNNSTNPNHAAAKYPTECATCHTTTAWKPSTFDHTPFFPIGSTAKHRPGRWNLCSDCHTNPADPKVFSCITCHEHNQTSMNSKHSGRAGYSYDSNACYRCHPRGNS